MIEEKKFKILIVEDEEISRNVYQLMLKNYNLSFCDSDKSMYNELAEGDYQLIIMDIGLPNSKDGLTLIKELKSSEKYFKMPIICATSYDTPEQKTNVLNSGTDLYLVKPVSRNILIDTIFKFQA